MKPQVHDQLAKLSEEHLEKVMQNTDPVRLKEYYYVSCYTVGLALCYLFNFKGSNEGEQYWNEVLHQYK